MLLAGLWPRAHLAQRACSGPRRYERRGRPPLVSTSVAAEGTYAVGLLVTRPDLVTMGRSAGAREGEEPPELVDEEDRLRLAPLRSTPPRPRPRVEAPLVPFVPGLLRPRERPGARLRPGGRPRPRFRTSESIASASAVPRSVVPVTGAATEAP